MGEARRVVWKKETEKEIVGGREEKHACLLIEGPSCCSQLVENLKLMPNVIFIFVRILGLEP